MTLRPAFVSAAALLLSMLFPSIAVAQIEERPETIKLTGDLKHYHGMVAAYRQGDDAVVAELLAWDQTRLEHAVRAINSLLDPNRPWSPEFLRSGALLQTAAMLECLETHADDRMYVHFGLAVDQLRQGSPALAPFAAKYYYAISRLFRSLNNVSTAEDVLEAARRAVPGDPLVLYESATIEEMRATAWQSAQIGPHGGSGGSFRDANALDDILKDRAVRLQHARDWLRQSVGTAPTALARLHYGRVLMMRKEDAEALVQLDAVRKETSDRATQYLSILFTAALDERRGQLETAATRYQEAIDCFPESDAAYTGLSEVLQSAGRGDQARAALHELLKPRPQRHEPWSWYFLEPKSVARERLAALFEEGRR